MIRVRPLLLLLVALAAAPAALGAQQAAPGPPAIRRPVWFEVTPPAAYQAAVERGTRAPDGAPGPRYWQPWTEYTLTARLQPEAKRLDGTGRIVYRNASPDTLRTLNLHLHQNLHAPEAIRLSFEEVTGGVELKRVAVDGRELATGAPQGPRYDVIGTWLRIEPPAPVLPGATVTLELDWGFPVPQQGASGRMGWSRDDLVFIAYWYPQMAVYDDVYGWHVDQFTGNAEFYAGFARYNVTIEAPAGWLIRATGELGNPEETLAPAVRDRLEAGASGDAVVHAVTAAEFGAGQTRSADGPLTWHFQADSVHDFAFSASTRSLLDVTRTPVGDRDGDGETDYARIEALYREAAPRWREAARYAAHAIRSLSDVTATPYPWPHMTAVEGAEIIGGGMEFPMLTLIGDYNTLSDTALYAVVAHELAHMWVPMIVSNNERRYSWMDEGTTTFNENQVKMDFYPGADHDLPDLEDYLDTAAAEEEGEMMRWSDFHVPGPAFRTASYAKPATVLVALRAVLGEETFTRAYHAFYDRWAWKHPYPWDLFRTFEDVAGRELDWFWHSWYFTTWTLDQAITAVRPAGDEIEIEIEDQGRIPMPVLLRITRADGSTESRTVPVDVWLSGATETTVTVPGDPAVTRVEIDPSGELPDADRSDNVWAAETARAGR